MYKTLLLLVTSLFATTLFAQSEPPNKSELTIPQIMQGEKFVGVVPENPYWSYDSKYVYFTWNPDGDTLKSLYRSDVNGSTPIKLTIEQQREAPAPWGSYNRDRSKVVYAKFGDVFLLDVASGKKLQLTATTGWETNPRFVGATDEIVYQRGQNIYRHDTNTGLIEQLTNFRSGTKKQDNEKNEQQQWLADDQLEQFEVLRWRKGQRDADERRDELIKPEEPLEIYLGKKSVNNIKLSPDMRYVTYQLVKRPKSEGTNVPNFVTESGYIEDLRSRAKVGSKQPTFEMGIYDRQRDTSYLIDIEQLEGIFDKPAYLKAYTPEGETFEPKYEKLREVVISGPVYPKTGNRGVVVVRSMDNKDRWICLLDAKTGQLKVLDRQHDEAWIGGPGIGSWNYTTGTLGWLDNSTIYFQSEKTGYSHLHTMNVNTGKTKSLTKGKFEVIEVELSNDKRNFYLTANAEGPAEHHFYRLPVKGGKLEKLTDRIGGHQVELSPDENYIIDRYSYSNKPWELYVMPTGQPNQRKQITKSTTAEFEAYDWRIPEIIRFTARDGASVPARLYKPDSAKKNGAAIIFVHGAGYLQNVHNWWSSYYREYMFHNFLTDNGYTVLDIDYRASNGYGRDWRTAIYQHMGGWDLNDQVDGAKYLVEKQGIDADRVGIYGGSYGGFITMMALFNEPETFRSGAALRSVTDWAHYNHGYTSNILNTPATDSIAYRKSSPIYHADGLEGDLLILHGMIDQNVQFQDVVRLSQRLIELGKDNWELAVFPVERHGFIEPSSWSDEYKRIYKLFDRTLKKE